jgi:hypothetical protein
MGRRRRNVQTGALARSERGAAVQDEEGGSSLHYGEENVLGTAYGVTGNAEGYTGAGDGFRGMLV